MLDLIGIARQKQRNS